MTETIVRLPIQPNQLCDRCSALAKVRATFLSGELHFCGHHAKDLKDSLVLKALEVYDPEEIFKL
jgi:hypothetical protein